LAKQLKNVLIDISLEELVSILTNKFTEVIEYAKLKNGEKTCQKTSLLFNPHRLDTKQKGSSHTIYEALQNEEWFRGMARAVLFKYGKVNELLYQVLQLGINGVAYINEFPPHIARDFCVRHDLEPSSNVLDPCAGWGGRMIGMSTIVNNYTCYEPSSLTYKGLTNLFEFIKSIDNNFQATIQNMPFEDAELNNEEFDFAITSPPYYDTEEYTNESTNSLNKFKTFYSWVDGFYLPLIEKTMDALKEGGVFILNIGDRRYPLSTILIDKFSSKYEIEKVQSQLSGKAGLSKSSSGESFYAIKKL